MTVKTDRRQARTRLVLRQALLALIEEKGIDRITVTDISNRADINRGTFYLHYRDVSDMLEQVKDEAFVLLKNIILKLDLREMLEYASQDMAYPKSIRIFEEFARNADFFKVILGPKGDLSYVRRLKELITNQLYDRITYFQPEENKLLVPIEYLIAYMSSANLGVLLHWLESGMKQSPQEMSLIMARIINHGPLAATGLKDRFNLS